MAEINYTVDANNAEEGFEAIPAGEYIAIIESSDYAPNKQGTGKVLSLTYQIVDGRYKGHKLFNYLNLEHQKENVVAIARKTMNAIGVAVGVRETVKDSGMLHFIPMKVDVIVKDDKDYGKKNEIKKHSPVNDQEAAEPAPAKDAVQKTETTNAANTESKPEPVHPWEK
ncbi:DUF669 domain-containing protein [Candidatus Pacearchaeota archaeon]|nr:DUF669 domain-containing protein [Candidatus Pacearchaeota archaeon]